jgi:hypothetical protein
VSYNKVLSFQNEARDPLGSIASSFKPKLPASRGAELVTTPVRFYLDTDLFRAFDEGQVEEYKSQLIREGRWRLPNDGGRYTIRFSYLDIPDAFGWHGALRAKWNGGRSKTSDTDYFLDFDMDGERLIRCTDVALKRFAGLSLEQKKHLAENSDNLIRQGGVGYDLATASLWWEANGWLVQRCDHDGENEEHSMLARFFLDVLVISLMDRSVVRAIIDRPEPSKKWQASGLAHPEQDVQEITIYCPGRVMNGDGSGTHASPRMHWRRGHTRTLKKGRDIPLVVAISPVWVNADEDTERTVPLRSYLVKSPSAGALAVQQSRERG